MLEQQLPSQNCNPAYVSTMKDLKLCAMHSFCSSDLPIGHQCILSAVLIQKTRRLRISHNKTRYRDRLLSNTLPVSTYNKAATNILWERKLHEMHSR